MEAEACGISAQLADGEMGGSDASSLGGFNDFGYVFASRFLPNDVVGVAGQLFAGAYPNGTYAVGCAEFRTGKTLEMHRNFFALSTNVANCGKSAGDIWVSSGNTHASSPKLRRGRLHIF